jgi:ABC-type multidrug transport system ATPase subunit
MRRRLDVGAALVHRPPVLFLDEPTTGLDPEGRNELWSVIRELVADGTTVLLTTQYLEEADRLADRIVVIDKGRVIADDTPEALKSRLGSTVTELGMGDAQAASRAATLVSGIADSRIESEGDILRITSQDGAKALIEVLRALDANGITPATLSVRQPSLDDVFLTLTGKHVEEESPRNRREMAKAGAR